MSKFWTVVGFTARNKFRSKAFLITTLIIVVIMSIGINLPAIISLFDKDGNDNKLVKIGYATQSDNIPGSEMGKELSDYLSNAPQLNVSLIEVGKGGNAEEAEAKLKAAIAEEKISGYLLFGEKAENGLPKVTYKAESMNTTTMAMLESILNLYKTEAALTGVALTDEQRAMLLTPLAMETIQIDASGEGKDEAELGVTIGAITVIILLLFFAIMVSGQMIASEVTAEKSSRVMEVLITSVPPLTQMFGKIFGVFIVGVSQVMIYVLTMFVNARMPHNKEAFMQFNIDLTQIDPMILVYALVYYFAGYFLYATLYAAVGSIVSRTEELGQAVLPITILSLAGFYIASFSMSNPDTMLVQVASYVPFFSPFVMLLRIGLTDPPVWQVLLSLGILFVSIYFGGWLSAKIYRTGVLMYGKRPTWKELRKAMKAYKI
ncbi:ABC transporter permease [Paenibacillus sp. NEAU-GSW1]|uniref:ABC transporter permease n=1 Tax=Paenibacillus sp. NEAU-GSW1 TaxID=2682486 RepID=UPI0012E103CD|nr:ABC transporter permease [Paenibacillus sp. NEAU-GSW1]MUT65347.1 ABC transporter permease [Paenibacillus sp. NEAU-GSW1]